MLGVQSWSPALTRWLARVALAFLLAMLLAYVPYRLLDPVGERSMNKLKQQLRAAHVRKAELIQQNAQYRREIRGLRSDPAVIEDIAREDLGMVRPHEVVIRVSPRRDRQEVYTP